MKCILVPLITTLGLAACSGSARTVTTAQATTDTMPTPSSSLVGSFTWQTDGEFGYRMLRPASWGSVKLGDKRSYETPGFHSQTDRIELVAANLQAFYKSSSSLNGLIATLYLFEQDPNLDGWTKGLEHNWRSNGLEPTLLVTLPQAKIYSVRTLGSPDVVLVADIVDQNQPLVAGLTASGSYADLERLRREGIFTYFSTMVASVHALAANPANVDPPLE